MSHLSRLFHFAKATGAAAIENFATEALAAAIRTDVAPLVAALELVGVQLQGATPDVQTQVPVDGVGILDLLITPNTGCPVVNAANELWPGSNWPAQENRIRKMIASRFAKWPSYTIQHKARFRAGLTMGIYHETETSDAWLGVWVWAKPNYVQERSRIADQTQGLQGSPWYREAGTWNPIGAYARLLDFSDHEQASAWLTARLHDLPTLGC